MTTMIGPTLPPHLRKKSPENEENGKQVDEDDYGPALPPALAARRTGVTAPVPVVPAVTQAPMDSDDDDDDIGPKPPSASTSKQEAEDGVREFLAREERRRELAKACIITLE